MSEPTLNSLDAAALEALINAGFDPAKVAPEQRERAAKVFATLGLLKPAGVTEGDRQTLVDVTMARIMRASAVPAEPALNWNDEEALEAWLMGAGVGVSDARHPRVERHEALASLVTKTGREELAASRDQRVDSVFAACMAKEAPAFKMDRYRGLRVRMADVISVAAVLFIAAAVAWPVMSGVRDQARRYACSDHLRDVSQGMGVYAGANQDQLPVVSASLGGGKWWEVGAPDGRSNSANLFHLAKSGFTKLASLACPGNPSACTTMPDPKATDWRKLDEVSYSYRIMFGPKQPHWNSESRVVILTDRSPVVRHAVQGQPIDPWENSANHERRGQKVMFSDGSVNWYRTPELDNRDNIWLPLPMEQMIGNAIGREVRLEGTEFPASARDAFVGP